MLLVGASPRDLQDDHRAIHYLLANKMTHAFVSTLVRAPNRRHPVSLRRWQLLDGYSREEIAAARLHGFAAAELIRDLSEGDRRRWPDELDAIPHPLVRDSAGDRLRGWA